MFNYRGVFILFSLIFLAGCSSISSGSGEDFSEDVTTGNEGIELSFLEGAPPKEVYGGANFDVFVDVRNKGVNNIERGSIRMSGLSPRFNINPGAQEIGEVLGRNIYPGGESKTLEWTVELKGTTVRKDISETLNVQVCYEGSVISEVEACVRPRPGSPGLIEGGCTLGKKSISNGQGGPIAITSFTEQIVKQSSGDNELLFFMDVKDVGGGNVVDKDGSFERCLFSARDKQEATVVIEEASLVGLGSLDCESIRGRKGELIMFNGQGRLTCRTTQPVPNDAHYSVDLYMKLNYGYVDSANARFMLKKDVGFS
jgi:hypothetical protein